MIIKTKKIFFYILILYLPLAYSCDSSNKAEIEQESFYRNLFGYNGKKKIDYHIDDIGWNIVIRTDEAEEIFYSLEKTESDTIKYLTLFKSKFDNKVRVDFYSRTFVVNDETHEIVMKLDTFYYFKQNAKFEKTFFVGEYNYRFENALLNATELDYYTLFKDSLGTIKGDNLPKLPSLSSQEKLKLQELVNKESN